MNQVDSWEDEMAANAEEEEHGGVLNQIVKERELATKVAKKRSNFCNAHITVRPFRNIFPFTKGRCQ